MRDQIEMRYQRTWIIYFWIEVIVFAFDTIQKIRGFPTLTPGPYYINGLRAISIIALFGFAYQKKLGLRIIWQVFFLAHSFFVFRFAFIMFYGLSNIVRLIEAGEIGWCVTLFMLLLLLFTYVPVYYANFSYAFTNKKIWNRRYSPGL